MAEIRRPSIRPRLIATQEADGGKIGECPIECRELSRGHPAQCVVVRASTWLRGPEQHPVARKVDHDITDYRGVTCDEIADLALDSELFEDLPPEGIAWRLAALDLSAGELPQAG